MSTINHYIDHTLLKPTATTDDICILCEDALTYDFYAVCVNSYHVNLAYKILKNSPVKIATVIGFPLGASTTETKVFEAVQAIKNGADEIDMVINIGALLYKDYTYVENEIRVIKKAIGNKVLKVIIETCYLNTKQILKATELVVNAKADFVKTSTGFGARGASFEDVKLMRSITKNQIQIKASGGIKDIETAQKYIAMGVTRLGTSSGVKLTTKNKLSI